MSTEKKSVVLPSRVHAKVPTTLCRICYCTLIDDPDQRANHERFHERLNTMRA